MDLDDVVPRPEQVTRQSRLVSAPPALVWDELHRVTAADLPLTVALTAARRLPTLLAGRAQVGVSRRPFVEHLPIPVLFSSPPSVVVLGGLSQAWRPSGGAQPPVLGATTLRAWSQPGWIKVGMEFRLTPVPAGTVLSSETRVVATDLRTRLLFAAYWTVVRAGSGAIRREVLRVVGRRAEARVAAGSV